MQISNCLSSPASSTPTRLAPSIVVLVALSAIALLVGLFLALHTAGVLNISFLSSMNALPSSLTLVGGTALLIGSIAIHQWRKKSIEVVSPKEDSFKTPIKVTRNVIPLASFDFFTPPSSRAILPQDLSRLGPFLPLYHALKEIKDHEGARSCVKALESKWWIHLPPGLELPSPIIPPGNVEGVVALLKLFLTADLDQLLIFDQKTTDPLEMCLQNLVLLRGINEKVILQSVNFSPLLAVWLTANQIAEINLLEEWKATLFPKDPCFKTWNFNRMLALRDRDPTCKLLQKLEPFVPDSCKDEFDALMNPDKDKVEAYFKTISTPGTHFRKEFGFTSPTFKSESRKSALPVEPREY